MSIRAQFQPEVDEFISDLHSFATGSYLAEGETEFWEQPFDPEALPQLKTILEKLLDALDALPADPDGELLAAVAKRTSEELAEFNRAHADAVIEPEERTQIQELLFNAAAATGADDEALAEIPELE